MKLTLTDIKSGYNLTSLNTNFEALEQELQNNVLYRNNPTGEPNQMEGSLDMNSNDVQNVRALDVQTFTIQGTDSTQFLDASVTEAFNWAQHPENTPVPEGTGTEYSAYHYSLKAADSSTAAQAAKTAAELALYNFTGTWYGSLASEPTVDPNGDAPTDGDVYLNSTDGIVYFYQSGTWSPLGGGNVTSIFGRTGAVVATAGDYTATQVTYSNATSGLTATDTQAAIDEVEGRLDTAEITIGNLATDIADGSFDPGSPTSVWTGPATSTDPATWTDNSTGFYLVLWGNSATEENGQTLIFLDQATAYDGEAVASYIHPNVYFINNVAGSYQVDKISTVDGTTTAMTIQAVRKV